MKNVLKIVFVIIGALIGAGFASGQEIYIFFFSHGRKGLFGIIISSVLMGVIIYNTLKILNIYKINSYKQFLDVIIEKNNKIKNIINIVINIFILITFFIMIAGFGAYFEQQFGINSLIGSTILAILSFIIFNKSLRGLVKANGILVPILISFLIIIGLLCSKGIHVLELQKYVIKSNGLKWLLDAILYCSYNSILLIPVIITLKDYIKNKKQNILISAITTIIVIILSIMIYIILLKVDVDITKLEMPAVYVVSNMFKLLSIIYGFIILASIFTTSISLGTSFLQNTCNNKKSYLQIAGIMCITSVLVSKIGFSNLVNILYPIFGYLGIIQIIILITHTKKKNRIM